MADCFTTSVPESPNGWKPRIPPALKKDAGYQSWPTVVAPAVLFWDHLRFNLVAWKRMEKVPQTTASYWKCRREHLEPPTFIKQTSQFGVVRLLSHVFNNKNLGILLHQMFRPDFNSLGLWIFDTVFLVWSSEYRIHVLVIWQLNTTEWFELVSCLLLKQPMRTLHYLNLLTKQLLITRKLNN